MGTYVSLVRQFNLAGIGYGQANSNVGLQQGTTKLWVRDLNGYGAQECAEPLTSNDPCGPTLGVKKADKLKMTDYALLSGWGIASNKDWQQLLSNDGADPRTAKELMESLGFSGVDNLVIYNDRIANATYIPDDEERIDGNADYRQGGFKGRCLVATGSPVKHQPFCDSNSNKNKGLSLPLTRNPEKVAKGQYRYTQNPDLVSEEQKALHLSFVGTQTWVAPPRSEDSSIRQFVMWKGEFGSPPNYWDKSLTVTFNSLRTGKFKEETFPNTEILRRSHNTDGQSWTSLTLNVSITLISKTWVCSHSDTRPRG